jgi:stage III sporulation protein AG
MDYYQKLLGIFKNIINTKNKKKVMENTAIVIIIGIIIIIIGSTFFQKNNSKSDSIQTTKNIDTEVNAKNPDTTDSADNDKNIEYILSQIAGAGKVSVLITYISGKGMVPATDIKKNENTTNEKDNDGGTRNISQNDLESSVVYSEEQSGVKKPVVIKEILPEVKGVVVVAEGASDAEVKENIINAVQVLTGVAPHKIQVFARGKN